MGSGRRRRFETAAILCLMLALGAGSGPAWAQVPLEPTDLEDLQETVTEQIEETSIEIPDTETEAIDSGIGGGGGGATADATEGVGLSSPAQTSSAGAGGSEKASHGGVERGPRARGSEGAGGRPGKATSRRTAGSTSTPAKAAACPDDDGRWVVAEEDSFGGHWQGSPASGILVFSSTREEVRFDVDEGFSLETVCWQTSNGVGGSDARLESIDPDTYAVTVEDRSAALEELTFSVTPPPGWESAEEGVLGLVIRRGGLATTGLRLVGLVGLDLLLLVSGAVLIRRARHQPRHTRPHLAERQTQA